MKYSNVTILLQGILHKDISLINILNIYTPLCQVVLSVYDSDMDEIKKICEWFPMVVIIIVENDISDYEELKVTMDREYVDHKTSYLHNGLYQICTTKKGLSVIHTEYVLKSRIDHCYWKIENFIKCGLECGKIVCSSIFTRGCNDAHHPARYHLSDCLFMGKTSEMKLCFDLCFEKKVLTLPEIGIWRPYFEYVLKDKDIHAVDNYVDEMCKLVEIYPINKLQPYRIKVNEWIKNCMDDSIKTTREYLVKGCDCLF